MKRLLLFALLAAGCEKKPDAPMALVTDATPPAVKEATVEVDASATTPPPPNPDPFGKLRAAPNGFCSKVGGKHVAEKDLGFSFVDGDDLLAIVNRSPTGVLAPDWAPSDLVDLRDGKPMSATTCEKYPCLRKEAADGLGVLLAAMKEKGFPGLVKSAFRSYDFQCGTFLNWAKKSDFCEATEQSALPGHSQHQLGTTVDLFTEEWAKDERGVFREGFGCTPAGRFLQEHAWDYGFVMPYPIHPDDRHPKQKCVVRWDIPVNINPRTGYRFEHWHIRYVGKDAALRFKKAWESSGVGTPSEITLEQWLRAEKRITGTGDAELPVCDGCNCGACATLAESTSCDKKGGALHLDEHGRPKLASETPEIDAVRKKKHAVEVKIDVPSGLATQPPIAAQYERGETFAKLSPYPDTEARAFPPLEHAWTIGVEPVPNDTGTSWPWRFALALSTHAQVYNRANVLLPARAGAYSLRTAVPRGVSKVKVTLLEGGVARGEPHVVELE